MRCRYRRPGIDVVQYFGYITGKRVFTAEDFDLAEKDFTLRKDREVFSEREGQNERPAIHGWSLAGVEGARRREGKAI